jgi:hypothetical protein
MTNEKMAQRIETQVHKSDSFGTETVEVVELKFYRRDRIIAHMDFVLRPDGRSSVCGSGGTLSGLAHLIHHFIETHKPKSLVDQVYTSAELKAAYRSGLGFHDYKGTRMTLTYAMERLKSSPNTGIMVSVGLKESVTLPPQPEKE